jgi:YD repeat-containing protein
MVRKACGNLVQVLRAKTLVRTELPNGVVETRWYDTLNRLVSIVDVGPGGTIASFQYTLDAVGNRTHVAELNGRAVDYVLDALDRLTEEKITDPVAGNLTIDYAYDAVGNRLTRNDSKEGLTTDTYDANYRLLTETSGANVTQYAYDANGNVLSRVENGTDRTFYKWDYENRLVSVDTKGVGTFDVTCKYDSNGIRVAQVVDGQETRFLIDARGPQPQVVEEYTPGGVIHVSYTYGNALISQSRGSQRSIYVVDALGSTRALTGPTGLVTDSYTYDAFGRLLGQTGTTTNLYLFTGEARDPSLGFDYLRARYYNPQTGVPEHRPARRIAALADLHAPVPLRPGQPREPDRSERPVAAGCAGGLRGDRRHHDARALHQRGAADPRPLLRRR